MKIILGKSWGNTSSKRALKSGWVLGAMCLISRYTVKYMVNIVRIFFISAIFLISFKAYAISSVDYFDISLFYGSWSWQTSTNCIETYTFNKNGILQIKSGDELTDNTYQIIKPKEPGFLAKLLFKTIKDYGGKDCANSATDSTGQSAEMYIGISPDGTEMLNCDTADGKDCWHLKKIKENK